MTSAKVNAAPATLDPLPSSESTKDSTCRGVGNSGYYQLPNVGYLRIEALPLLVAPQTGAKGADLAKFYGAVMAGDPAAIARLVNAGNVNLPLIMPNGTLAVMTPIGGALQHCGLPQVAPKTIAATVAQLIALGADPEQRAPDGTTV